MFQGGEGIRILLLGFANIRYMPYARFWLDLPGPAQHEFHLLYWNRDGSQDPLPQGVVCHEFSFPMEDQIPKFRKLRGFGDYRRFALELLDRERFDRIVVLHSLPGILLADRLLGEYRERFFLDYRDVTYESFPPYRWLMHRLVKASVWTCISSDGFRQVLPKSEKLLTVHNLRPVSAVPRTDRSSGPIRIGFWGLLRHEGLNRRLVEILGNDERFLLHYYGREQAVSLRLKSYVNQIFVNNIFFHGSYRPGDQDRFAEDTDLVHNLYSNRESPSQALAMTNKFYDALCWGLPQLCARDSWMGNLVEQEKLGLTLDPEDPKLGDRLADYLGALDREALRQRCRAYLDRVLEENRLASQILAEALDQ